MNINTIRRPWETRQKQQRLNRDPFYQSPSWKGTRAAFRRGVTIVDGVSLPNIYCVECWKHKGRRIEGAHCDHVVPIVEGGDRHAHSNLQTLCDSHHARKSAEEGNNRRRK